ncbi:A-kinase anchor protein 13 isoform X2 [Engraulis encrasicolus]|uniref:A-kinase anchor protein 13 isoform X2 n=1 Tax=Engraulis encrasicolus TaxID=184585 RepID=UPI002FCFFA0C
MSESEQPTTKTTRPQRRKYAHVAATPPDVQQESSDTQVCEEEEEDEEEEESSSQQETSSPDWTRTPELTPAATTPASDESSEGKAGSGDAASSTCSETVTDAQSQTGDLERGLRGVTAGSSDTHLHTLTHAHSHDDKYSRTLTQTHTHDDDRCQDSEPAQQLTTSTITSTITSTTTSSPPPEGDAVETGRIPEKQFGEEARGARTIPSQHHHHQASKQGQRSEVTEEETAPPITGAPRTKRRALLDAAVSMETKQEVAEEVRRVAGQRSRGADGEVFPAGGHAHGRKSAMRRVAGRHLTPALSLDSRTSPIHTDKECFGGAAPPHTLSHSHSHAHTHTHTHRSLERGPSIDSADSPQSSRSSISTLQRDSGSDTDGFCSTDPGEDNVFRKDECVTCGGSDSASEVSVSCSSADDAASLGHRSSSSTSSSRSSSSRLLSARFRQTHSHAHSHAHTRVHGAVVVTTGSATGGGGGGGLVSVDTEEEAKDRVSEVPLRSSLLRTSIRSLSPFRRHSWGPGKNASGEGDMNQRSAVPCGGKDRLAFHRRSLSWCPSDESMSPCVDQCSDFSFSLEGLVGSDGVDGKSWQPHGAGGSSQGGRRTIGRQESDDRGSLVSLTEEEHEHESDMADTSSLDSQKSRRYLPQRRSAPSMTLPLTKSVSMLAISQRDIDGMNSYTSNMGSVDCSITEEGLGPLRDFDGKGSTKVSRTFSYLKSKMSKRSRDKESRHKEKEAREREKQRASSGHVFGLVASHQTTMCPQCHKAVSAKDAFVCNNCYVCVHKGCRDSLPVCAKKQHYAVPDSSTLPTVTLRPKSSSSRERPWSAILSPEEHSLATAPRRHTLMPSNLSKSISISNIAGHQMFDDMPSLKSLRVLSQSTDSLNKPSRAHESTESLVDEGTEMIDSQLLGEFEADARELEADSWSFSVDKKILKHLKKDTIKRQDVIYELIQTELHHVRTLRIMADVYYKGLMKEVGLEYAVLDRMFPALDDLQDLHNHFLSAMLERKREAQMRAAQQHGQGPFVIERIGDVLIEQFSGPTAECMKRVYGKFCSRHNEAVNLYKEHHAKDKRFQAFIKRKMSSSIVRRMGIPECILLVTQRITKYPVLLQRILQHTRDDDEEYEEVSQALSLVKEAVAAVDVRVSEQEKRKRLKEIHARTDSKSIMRMKSGQMFAREDLLRRRLVHDGALQLKTNTGRLKDVQAVLLSDILVFLQEKDQKYVFASLDQRSTVLSLQKLIAREVANEERALFLITAGTERPEMVEVHASTKEDRNAWMQLLQQTMQSIEKDEDEGIPSENEEDKRLMESKAKELREVLQRKDEQIVLLLQEKMKLFRDMCDCPPPPASPSPDDPSGASLAYKMLFRACSEDVPKGEPIMINALKEVEMLQTLVNGSLGGAVGQQASQDGAGGVGPVVLPRRAETFGGFDSHLMNIISKSADKEDGEDAADLRRTESDSVLKKGGNANLLLLLKRNSEVLQSVTNLHDLLASLQAVVVQQDTFIEDQRQALSERPSSVSSSSSITSSASSSRASSRPNSLIEQERQRSLEKQRQEATALQRQRDAHAEERKRRERHWETRERDLAEREAQTGAREEELRRKRRELEQAKQELQQRKEDYQRDLERLRDGQRRLEREKEALEQAREEKHHIQRTPSSTSEDSLFLHSAGVFLEPDPSTGDNDTSRKHSLGRLEPPTTTKAKGLNQMPSRFLQLTKGHKDKKEKKKKKNKHPLAAESQLLPLTEPVTDGEIYFC